MTTITIPKETRSNTRLVAVPQRTYAEFLAWQKAIKSRKTFKPTAADEKAITRGRKELLSGKYVDLSEVTYVLEH